jgi:tetratricopeptide (TPR) repeat protein
VSKQRRAAPRPPTPAGPAPAVWWRVAIIVLAGTLAYANSLSGPFIFDDDATVVENTSIRDLRSKAVFFPEREVPTAGRPIVNLSFALNHAIGGTNVRGYHVVNIATHLLCAVVLFGLVRRTLGIVGPAEAGHHAHKEPVDDVRGVRLQPDPIDIAFAVALVWVLHPLNTEAVDYVTQRTESMMALFYLLTMYVSARSLEVRLKPDTTRANAIDGQVKSATTPFFAHRSVAILCCALGMACKESMVTAPVMVFLYDRVFVFDSIRKAMRARWPLYAGLAATWIVLAAVNWSGARTHSAGFSTGVSPWTYLLNQSVMIVRYLRLAIWPTSLVLAYGTPQPVTLGAVLPYALVVVALLAVTAFALARRPLFGFLGAWIFITLAPTTTIVPIATEVGAERRMYLALAAIVTLAVAAVLEATGGLRLQPDSGPPEGGRHQPLKRGRQPRIAVLLLTVTCIALATGTVLRNREYQSSLTMARTVLERWPTPFAHAMVGTELAKIGRHEEAIAELRQGADQYPKAGYHLGGELYNQGKVDEAFSHLQTFVEREPYALEAVRARLMMGRALLLQRKYDAAIAQFRLVLSMTAGSDELHTVAFGLIGDALFGQDQSAEAARYYRGYLAAKPGDVSARGNLAKILFNAGDLDGAAAEARAILRIRDDAVAHDLLGRTLASEGNLGEAEKEFERALKVDPTMQQAREDLAMVRRARGEGIRD